MGCTTRMPLISLSAEIRIAASQKEKMMETTQKKKRLRNPEKTREKLLKAAVDMIADKGEEALSLKEVAKRADVSRSATYLHFGDRDELLRAAKTWITEKLHQGVAGFDEKTPLYDRTLHTVRLVMENPEASRVMMVDALTKGEFDPSHPLFKVVMKRLKYLKKRGGLHPSTDLEVHAFIHLASSAAALMLQKQHEGEAPDALAERFTREWTRILQPGLKLS